ncbi:MAG TPA: serine/threonine-protein kinase [Chloroflexia bacterium]|nr:serine/threonine-protein kinase [Chloroflexia bacterium]
MTIDSIIHCPCCAHALPAPLPECPVCGCAIPTQANDSGRLLRNGELRLIERLGGGGMGSLYLAEDTLNGQQRVVKELRSPVSRKTRNTFETMFDQEARLLARLSKEHAAIPRYYDAFMDSGSFYIVLEYVPGQNLEQYLKAQGGTLPLAEVVEISSQVVDVLCIIHYLRPDPVIHGDIKPSNLIRRPDGQIVLIDFGLARVNVAPPPYMPARSSAFGTPGYSPIEQWEGHPGPAADIFALGATIHQLISGRNPREPFINMARVTLSEISTLTNFPPITNLVPETPPILETLITQMLRRRPVERPSTQDVRARLQRLSTFQTG